MITALLPFVCNSIPAAARTGLLNGTLKLTGSVIRRLDGQIFCHLQEAGPLTKMIGSSLNKGVTLAPTIGPQGAAAMALADLAAQVGTFAETDLIRRGVGRLEAGVERIEGKLDTVVGKLESFANVGLANLALNAAGIGISVAGFALLSAKIDRVQESIHSMAGTLDVISHKIDQVRQDQIDRDFTQVRSLASLFDEAWGLTDRGRAEQQWMRVVQDARTYQDRFANQARDLLAGGPSGYLAADPALDAVALISGLRVAALAACNETELARSVAGEATSQIEQLTGAIGVADLALHAVPEHVEPGSQEWGIALATSSEAARVVIAKVRQREALAATRAAPFDLLERRGVAPREWLERARSEAEAPLLVLLEDGAEEVSDGV